MSCPGIRKRCQFALVPVIAVVASFGCAGTRPSGDASSVSRSVDERFGQRLCPNGAVDEPIVPPGLSLGQPLVEDQAVLLALWNNPAFLELLVDLKLTRADLVQAGLLPNPEIVFTFGVQDKPFKYLFDFPIESLWLRPIRIAAAEQENARACARLTQAALDLIRDTRQAYADVALARERLRVAEQAVALRGRIADLAATRLKAGDASVQDAATARTDALQAKQDSTRIGFEVPLAEARLKNLTGLAGMTAPLVLDADRPDPMSEFDADALVAEAIQTRPDAIAAEFAVQAAAKRAEFARLFWFRFLGILDATSGRVTGHEFSPAFRVTIPIFNRNQGGVARADAELEQAVRRKLSVQNQIVLDVRLAHTRHLQSRSELVVLRESVRPEVEAGIQRAEKAFSNGNVSYLIVLEITRQLIDTYTREAQLRADLRRAWADLERSVGRRLDTPPAVKEPAR